MLFFWIVTPSKLVGRYQRFGGTYRLHGDSHQRFGEIRCLHRDSIISPKRWYLSTSPQGVTTQKTNIDIFTAERTSDLIFTLFRKCLHIKFQIKIF
jgi:hypothetical protein